MKRLAPTLRLLVVAALSIPVAALGEPVMKPAEPWSPIPELAKRELRDVGEVVRLSTQSPAAPAHAAAVPQKVWSDAVFYPGASYIAPHFSRFSLPAGTWLIVRSPDGSRSWRYSRNGKGDLGLSEDGFWGIHIWGDTAFVELWSRGPAVPADAVVIDSFARGFDLAEVELEPKALCGSDDSGWAKCYQTSESAIYNESRAVARLLINGTGACTGWLVGTEGHVMTNEHCITTAADAVNTNFEFMAEGATCSTSCASWGACPGTVVATTSTLVKLSAALDYALVRLPSNPTATYGYMQLRSTGAVLNERIYIPQHPAHHGKKIAVTSTASQDTGGVCRVNSLTEAPCSGSGYNDVGYMADTQGGSSGSPVLGYNDHLVVALHHCADCPNRGVPIQRVITDLGTSLPAGALGSGGGTNAPPTASFTFTTSSLTATFTDTSTDSNGTVTGWSWNFGDSTTSTTRHPVKTYASAGTRTVSLTATDNGGATGSTSQSVTVSTTTTVTALTKGVAVTGQSGGVKQYSLVVPAGSTNLTFTMSGGTGDADMHVKFGSMPTTTTYDCRPYKSGNAETCTFAAPSSGTYYVMLNPYSAFTGVSLVGNYTVASTCTAVTEVEPNNSMSTTASQLLSATCNQISGNFTNDASSNQNDYYRISLPAGRTVTALLNGLSVDYDAYIYRTGSSTAVATGTASGTTAENISWTNNTGATTVVYVRAYRYSSTKSTYQLRVSY